MTTYAGEVIRISSTAKDFDGTALDAGDVTEVFVAIYAGGTLLVAETPMAWDADHGEWFYDWDTGGATPRTAGTYLAKVRLVGASIDNWEFHRFRLNRNPV